MMHRAYQPLTPTVNVYLKKRWDQTHYDEHRKKVLAAKPMIDNKPPKTYMHLHLKLKKLKMEEERLTTVERDNRILLQKMAHIMKFGGNVVDQKHDYKKKSLNKTKRQRELLRITHENLAILKRIQARNPDYSHIRWENEHRINTQYKINISKYPHKWSSEIEHYKIRKIHQNAANQIIRHQVNNSFVKNTNNNDNETSSHTNQRKGSFKLSAAISQ